MMAFKRWLGMGAVALLLAACSSVEGPTYAELSSISTAVDAQVVWKSRVGAGSGEHFARLAPQVQDGVVYVADRHGLVVALNKDNGQRIWSQRLGGRPGILNRWFRGEPARLSGITVAGSMVFLGSENGVVYALNSDTGEIEWQQRVPGEVLAAPTVGEGRVILHLGSGYIVSLSARTGEQQWRHEEEVALLSLRGVSRPVIASGGVIFGTATGKAVVLLSQNGQMAWEERLGVPSGSTELERVVDVDGSPLLMGAVFVMSAFNGELVALDLRSGEVLWKQNHGAWRTPVQSQTRIIVVNQDSHVLSLDRNNGLERWRNSELFNRSLTEPALLDSYLISADRFGYLHWLDRANGNLVGRLELNKDVAIQAAPVVSDNRIYVQDSRGYVYAIRHTPRS